MKPSLFVEWADGAYVSIDVDYLPSNLIAWCDRHGNPISIEIKGLLLK